MHGFFSDIQVIDAENVPQDGPLIVCCTHWNMIVDPAVLSGFFPHGRMLHYWAKSTIFINKPVSALLRDAGNIPVDRKNKDNQALFSGTFDALKLGEVVAIFPEGTSYTEPHLQAIKEGASWAALEYAKNIRAVDGEAKRDPAVKDPQVIVASIVYTQKTNYRSRAVMQFGKPIPMKGYIDSFLNSPDGPKGAVKELTKEIRDQMIAMTVDAPDWDTLRAAETARQLLWGDDDRIPLKDFRAVSQSLVDLFSPASPRAAQAASARAVLIEYDSVLRSNGFTNASLNALPLPRILDPRTPAAPPARLRTLWALTKTSLTAVVLLPFFLLPLLAHLPVYAIGKSTQLYLNSVEAEAFAQNKIVFSLLALIFAVYPAIFFATWALWLFTPLGLLVALAWTAMFAVYHTRLVDRNYGRWKRLVAAWRVLVGIWWPEVTPASESQGETKIRKMLRLRSEAAKSVADLALNLESEKEGREEVQWYRSLGARVALPGGESDHKGRLQ